MVIKNLGKQLEDYCSINKLEYKDLNSRLNIPHITLYRWRKLNRITPYFYRVLVSEGIIR